MSAPSFKYELGQRVYVISQHHQAKLSPCPVCEGTGRVALVRGGYTTCPEAFKACRFGQITERWIDPWEVCESGFIGQRRMEETAAEYCDGEPALRIQYMLDATGVRSGMIWSEEDLAATREEAQAICDERNTLTEAPDV